VYLCEKDDNLSIREFARKSKNGKKMQYLTEIASFIAGMGAGWTLKVFFDKSKNATTITGNKAGGDIAGRDIHKR
jgi:hypothetical protein